MALPRKLVNALKAGTYKPSAASKKARAAASRVEQTRNRIGAPSSVGRTPAELAHDFVTPQPSVEDLQLQVRDIFFGLQDQIEATEPNAASHFGSRDELFDRIKEDFTPEELEMVLMASPEEIRMNAWRDARAGKTRSPWYYH
jgi:hypothetical protein